MTGDQLFIAPAPAMDLAVERGVAGGIVLVATVEHVLKLVALGVQGEQFYRAQYGHLFEVAVLDAEQGVPPDPVMLAAGLERLGHEPRLSPADIDELASHAPTAGHYVAYAKRLIELARWRADQEALYGMVAALEKRDRKTWDGLLAGLSPAQPESEPRAKPKAAAKAPRTVPAPSDRTGLRLIVSGTTGEVIGSGCEHCQDTQDQLDGANAEIRTWRAKYAEATRDREAAAHASEYWMQAKALFELWQRLTNHPRSKFGVGRFETCEPFLRIYGLAHCERAIAGLAFDHMVRLAKNGRERHFDEFERAFQSQDKFEKRANDSPRDWKPVLDVPRGEAKPVAVPSDAERVEAVAAEIQAVVQQPVAAG